MVESRLFSYDKIHVSMSGYCATLKVDAGYHKSVNWIVSQPTVGVYQYFDTCSDTAAMVCEDGEIIVASPQCGLGILAQQHFHLTCQVEINSGTVIRS